MEALSVPTVHPSLPHLTRGGVGARVDTRYERIDYFFLRQYARMPSWYH